MLLTRRARCHSMSKIHNKYVSVTEQDRPIQLVSQAPSVGRGNREAMQNPPVIMSYISLKSYRTNVPTSPSAHLNKNTVTGRLLINDMQSTACHEILTKWFVYTGSLGQCEWEAVTGRRYKQYGWRNGGRALVLYLIIYSSAYWSSIADF